VSTPLRSARHLLPGSARSLIDLTLLIPAITRSTHDAPPSVCEDCALRSRHPGSIHPPSFRTVRRFRKCRRQARRNSVPFAHDCLGIAVIDPRGGMAGRYGCGATRTAHIGRRKKSGSDTDTLSGNGAPLVPYIMNSLSSGD
jgi:hypothetical protein